MLLGHFKTANGIGLYFSEVPLDISLERKDMKETIVRSYSMVNGCLSAKIKLKRKQEIAFQIVALNGRRIHVEKVGSLRPGYNSVTFNMSFLQPGGYVLRCFADGFYKEERKIVYCN